MRGTFYIGQPQVAANGKADGARDVGSGARNSAPSATVITVIVIGTPITRAGGMHEWNSTNYMKA